MNQYGSSDLASRITASFGTLSIDHLLDFMQYGGTLWLDSGDGDLRFLVGQADAGNNHWMHREPSLGKWLGLSLVLPEVSNGAGFENTDVEVLTPAERQTCAQLILNEMISWAEKLADEL